jgi:uncharacterized protein
MRIHSLAVIITGDCNLGCRYCYLRKKPRVPADWPAVRGALDALLPLVADDLSISFTGGEPLMALPLIRGIVSYVKRARRERRLECTLFTNGTLLESATLRFLERHRFTVNLSFDGVPAAQHLRGAGTFHRLDSLLDTLRQQYPSLFSERLGIAMTLAPETVPHLPQSVAYFIDKEVQTFTVLPAMGTTTWQPAQIQTLERAFAVVFQQMLKLYDERAHVPFALFRKSLAEQSTKPKGWACGAHSTEGLAIDLNGEVHGCLLATRTYQMHPSELFQPAIAALRLGRAADAGFATRAAGMSGAAGACGAGFSQPGRRYSSYRKCADCEFLPECQACPLAAAPMPRWDDTLRVPDFICAFNQVSLAYRRRFPPQPTPYDYMMGRVPLPPLGIPRREGARDGH